MPRFIEYKCQGCGAVHAVKIESCLKCPHLESLTEKIKVCDSGFPKVVICEEGHVIDSIPSFCRLVRSTTHKAITVEQEEALQEEVRKIVGAD